MPFVHYKFKSELEYSIAEFQGLRISVADMKKTILDETTKGKFVHFDIVVSCLIAQR